MTDNKETKKVLILLGSPRKNGNSAALAARIAAGAESSGAEVESLFIHDMDIRPCRACWSCQKPESSGCVIKDDMQLVFPKLAGAHAWVIATPVHWFNMSAQTKLWMDRSFALPRYGKNPFRKKIGIAMSYGDTDAVASGAINAIRCFQDSYKYAGATIVGMVHASAIAPGDMLKNEDALKAAEKLGRILAD